MLLNYFKIAVRNLLKNKLFSFINILGMSISLAYVFIITLFVKDELSFDQHITDASRKFGIYNSFSNDNGSGTLIAIAFVIIIPISYYTSSEWLEGFAYRIEISPVIFLKAAALILFITIATVIYQSWKAASGNPAQILKND